MIQGPMDGTEHLEKISKVPPKPKKSTLEKHWAVIDQYDVGIVAQLASVIESDGLTDLK